MPFSGILIRRPFSDSGTDHSHPIQCSPILILRGIVAILENALQQLRVERREAQLHVENLGRAISVMESLNGSGTSRNASRSTRTISAASRRKMAAAQRARWAAVRKGLKRTTKVAKATGSASMKRTMSAAARRKILAAQRARWTKVKGQTPTAKLT